MKYLIKVNEDACIGCGLCESLSSNFSLNSEGKAVVKKKDLTEAELEPDQEAAKNCPTEAIIITKEI